MLRDLAARQAYQRYVESDSKQGSEFEEADDTSTGVHQGQPFSSETEFIYVRDDFQVQTGVQLTENMFVGNPLGYGLQVRHR